MARSIIATASRGLVAKLIVSGTWAAAKCGLNEAATRQVGLGTSDPSECGSGIIPNRRFHYASDQPPASAHDRRHDAAQLLTGDAAVLCLRGCQFQPVLRPV